MLLRKVAYGGAYFAGRLVVGHSESGGGARGEMAVGYDGRHHAHGHAQVHFHAGVQLQCAATVAVYHHVDAKVALIVRSHYASEYFAQSRANHVQVIGRLPKA